MRLLLLTQAVEPSVEVLPALSLLPHAVRILPAQATALLDAPPCDAVLVDGRRDLPHVRSLTRLIRQTGIEHPLIVIVTEGGLTALQRDWGIDEFVVDTIGRVRTRTLDLTFKEFELLRYLAQHPGRVFSRAQLLQEVWGYDYFGGTRTVDVHVRRLRAKLGPEHEALIGTVRNVGYRFVPARPDDATVSTLTDDDAEIETRAGR